MADKLKIGIVGCGAIGKSLAKAIVKDFAQAAKLVAFYDVDPQAAIKAARRVSLSKNTPVESLMQLIDRSELVIEAASAKSSWEIARKTILRRKDIMIMSVGGITHHARELHALAKKYNVKVYIPSGALSGIDALKAAKIDTIKKVVLTTRKNPRAFSNVAFVAQKNIPLTRLKKDKVLFSGSAQEAVRYFPQNINVAALLGLAGIGEVKTQVKIIASPRVTKNIHEVTVISDAATIVTRTENILHPENPKTSFLAVLSAIATLKQIFEPIKIGT